MIASPQEVCTLRRKQENTMFHYPARLKADEAGFTVTVRDMPEAITAGATRAEAIEMAGDALATAMDFNFEDKRPVPQPSDAKRGDTGPAETAETLANSGAPGWDRTSNPCLRRAVLYPLSYGRV
jgi:predicted RNase H-like HicB family nuclease